MVVEGREKGVGGRIEYCAALWGEESVVALAGMCSVDVAATPGTDSSVVASKSFTGIVRGVARSKLSGSKGSFQSGRSVVLVARKSDSENSRVGSG